MADGYEGNGGASFVMGLLTGTVIGAGLGLLFAPKAGAELRSQISEKAGNLANTASEGYRRASETAGEWAEKGREMGKDIGEKGKEMGKDAYDRTRDAVSRGTEEAQRYVREASNKVAAPATKGTSTGLPRS